MNPELRKLYHTARAHQVGWREGWAAVDAWEAAKTVSEWDALESQEIVRLRVEQDWDWEPDCDCGNPKCPSASPYSEAFGVIGEYRFHNDDPWMPADSVWGHVGYSDPADWRENPYVVDIMQETIAAYYRNAREESRS